jgi:CRP-like cAMP-binding protein
MPIDGFVPGNRLLQRIPPEIRARLSPETVTLHNREVLHRIGRHAEHVYFPHSGMASIVIEMADRTGVEAATIGNEGMVGIGYLLADTLIAEQTIVQQPGEGARIRLAVLRTEFDHDQGLRSLLLRYTQVLLSQIAQAAACNRLHSTEQRCARWLLATHDGVEGDEFPLTQDFLAIMLGVRRAGVSQVQHSLQSKNVIDYTRGQMTILDRPRLEQVSCECYRAVRNKHNRFYSETSLAGDPNLNNA